MEPNDVSIYKQIDEILWLEWDPLGVNTFEEARDEYYAYLPFIFELKKQGADRLTIARALHEVTLERMSLMSNWELCLEVADKIWALKG